MPTETQTMLIHTLNFGDLEVPEEKTIAFKEGIPGFPQIHRFTFLEFDDMKPFQYLQSMDDPPIAFLVINPFLVDPAYQFQLSASDMEDIQSSDPAGVAVYAVATVPANPEEATLNLMAPVVVNETQRCGKQVILHDSGYSVKHPLFGGADKSSKGGE